MDYTQKLSDFSRDSETITLYIGDYLYLGYQARFYSFYFYATAFNTNPSDIVLEVYDGSSWNAIGSESRNDDTLGFSRSGFVQWSVEEDEFEESEHEGIERYWLRISVTGATTAMSIVAINALFCDDDELQKEYPPVSRSDFKLGEPDYTHIHTSVRDYIVQTFRNRGLRKLSRNWEKWVRVTAIDILDIQEVRLAARYLALHKILLGVSDNPEDNWAVKAAFYLREYEKQISLAYLSFDASGEGDKSKGMQEVGVGRLYR